MTKLVRQKFDTNRIISLRMTNRKGVKLNSIFIILQSVVAKGLLTDISDKANYVPIMMNFSAQTSSQRTQEMIEVKLEKKRKNILGLYSLM